ncbi:amidohydrolase family protein [Nonomuraea jiangxiensis]|uniref:Imidazolonepropionase n=1 Tax=Nonomuraea jiangxiensis TaxID=633440 RepID=A0A1G9B230_9ACTN|nr:amidohydrolase family protein [Nonomuraea jiangxiensis]SDK33629.1 Imidazolonepropionase [Nonomuraea jiangxiensis]
MKNLHQSLISQSIPPTRPLALTGTTVIDIAGGSRHPGMTVVVVNGLITAVGPDPVPPSGAQVIDAAGTFVIPGLWDMHVHTFQADRLPYFLLNGVTGIRHMGGAPVHMQWRRRLGEGDLVAPRMVIASRIVDGPRPLRPYSLAVGTEEEARAAVRQSRDEGADFVKVYNLLPRDAYFALAREARRAGMPFAGHVPFSVGVAEAAAAGQRSIEHLEGVFLATSTRGAELAAEVAAVDHTDMAAIGRVFNEVIPAAAASHDPGLAAELYGVFAEHGTWHVPTLAVLQASAYAGGDDFPLEGHLHHIEPDLRHGWASHRHWAADPARRAAQAEYFQRRLRVVGDLHRAGVGLLAGTDTFVPGFSLHDELALLVLAGLTPAAALRAATLNPARFLDVADSFGSVEEGKVADLVLLGGDPLDDIGQFARHTGARPRREVLRPP